MSILYENYYLYKIHPFLYSLLTNPETCMLFSMNASTPHFWIFILLSHTKCVLTDTQICTFRLGFAEEDLGKVEKKAYTFMLVQSLAFIML